MVALEREKKKIEGKGRREITAASVIYGWIAERRQVVRTPVIGKRGRNERLGIRKRWHDKSRTSRKWSFDNLANLLIFYQNY